MIFYGHDIQFEYSIYEVGEKEGARYRFDTIEAVDAFVLEARSDKRNIGKKESLQLVIDGDPDDETMVLEYEDIQPSPLSFNEKALLLQDIPLQLGWDMTFWPTCPIVRINVVVEGKNKWKTFMIDDIDSCEEAIASMNEYIAGFGEEVLKRNSKVYAYVAPNNMIGDHRLVKAFRKILLFENGYRLLDFYDYYSFFLTSCEMISNKYATLSYIYTYFDKDADNKNREIYGPGYRNVMVALSREIADKEVDETYLDLSCILLEECNVTALEEYDVGNSSDDSHLEDALLLSDFIVVIVDKAYIETSKFDEEVVPLAKKLKTVLVHADDTRLSEDKMSQLGEYIEYIPGITKADEIKAFLQIG